MAENPSPLLYDEEFTIEKRADGTEDFHCVIGSCAGVFSYRTLRALNNHRASSHTLSDIPKRKRGPKKNESSRIRSRSADAIKRQVMKRAIDLSKREQGCRSMARLRASRLAMAQTPGGIVDNSDHMTSMIQKVDKSLENWEGGSSRRRSLLERRVQMARLEWAMKGEVVPLLNLASDTTKGDAKNDGLEIPADDGSIDVEVASVGTEVADMLHLDAVEDVRGSLLAMDADHTENGGVFPAQLEADADGFAGRAAVHISGMEEVLKGNLCGMEVHMDVLRHASCHGKYETRHIWHNPHPARKFVAVNEHEMKFLNDTNSAQQADDELLPSCFDRCKLPIGHNDSRLF